MKRGVSRGLSVVVVLVSLIFITVVAIVLVWFSFGGTLGGFSDKIRVSSLSAFVEIEPESVRINHEKKEVSFSVANVGNEILAGLVAVLHDSEGNSKRYDFTFDGFKELEFRDLYIPYGNDLTASLVRIVVYPKVYDSIMDGFNELSGQEQEITQNQDGYDASGTEGTDVNTDGQTPDDDENDPATNSTESFQYQTDFVNLSEKTIVIYNENDPESMEIADYYALQREVPQSNLCPVKLPVGHYANYEHMLGARNTIVKECICNLIPLSDRPSPCDGANAEKVAEVSPISHATIIKGVPARISGLDALWPSGNFDLFLGGATDPRGRAEPSLDYYLTYLFYHNDTIINDGNSSTVETGMPDKNDNSFYGSPPSELLRGEYLTGINVSKDRVVAYGRIEAMTKERTLELIDRTIVAESQGVDGNFFVSINPEISDPNSDSVYKFFSDITEADIVNCTNELLSGNDWPSISCGRVGPSLTGQTPGESSSNVKSPVNAVSYFDMTIDQAINGQNGFDDFSAMLKWHKFEASCVELCRDLPTQSERDSCKANSEDYFKEINTQCVGVSPGFMGFHYMSWPVQYYGFFPEGWSISPIGEREKTPPVVLTGGAYQNQDFTDDNYLHFGALNFSSNPVCADSQGSLVSCKENLAVHLRKTFSFNPSLPVVGTKDYLVRFKYRNSASSGGLLRVSIFSFNESNVFGVGFQSFQTVPMDQEHLVWQNAEIVLSVNGSEVSDLAQFSLEFQSFLSDNLFESFDIDAVEVIDVSTGENIFTDSQTASFARPLETINPGDAAANAIDRLGGIAWWGSSSHHLTGGHAYSRTADFAGAFYSGRTLGESLAFISNRAGDPKRLGVSGIIYGDPLYSPVASKAFLKNFDVSSANKKYNLVKDNFSLSDKVHVNIFNGKDNKDGISWELSVCDSGSLRKCEDNNWTSVLEEQGAVYESEIPFAIGDFLEQDKLDQEQEFSLRLRAGGANSQNGFSSYMSVKYVLEPLCPGDVNGDRVVNQTDQDIFFAESGLDCNIQSCSADINDDGFVSGSDQGLILGAWGFCD